MTLLKSAFLRVAMVGLVAVGFAACEDEDLREQLPQLFVNLAPDAATLNVGETLNLVANANGLGTNETANFTFTSSNQAVATVANGVVTAVAPGVAVITASTTTSSGRNGSDASTITVVRPTEDIRLQLQPQQTTLNVGGSAFQFIAVVTGTTNTAVTCTSSAPTVATATANANGCLVNPLAPGTAVLTVRSAANNQVVQTATVTVLPQGSGLTVSPAQISALGVGRTETLVATVAGTSNQAVTCTSSNTAVATVTPGTSNVNCTVTGQAPGNAVITVRSQANNQLVQTVSVTVVGANVAIATIPASPAAGEFNIQANVNVPPGTADSLVIRLRNTQTGAIFNITCQRFTSAGLNTLVTCPINPADIDPNTPGAQVLPNGTYNISAVLFRGTTESVTANFGTPLTTGNVNTINGVVSFDNSLVDTDNLADAATDVDAAGNLWFGGAATVTLTPSVFAGNNVGSARVVVDLNCNGAADAGEPARSVTITNGTGSVTFPESVNTVPASGSGGIDNVEDPSVCFVVDTPRDAGNALVAINNGTGNVTFTGTAGTNTTVGATQQMFRVDNVEPTSAAFLFAGGTNNIFVPGGFNFALSAFDASATSADAGVGRVTTSFFAVPSGTTLTTQANIAAAATDARQVTTSAGLQQTLTNNAFVVVARYVDALGNVRYQVGPNFGVDLSAPAFSITGGVANNSVNSGATTLSVAVTDTISGPAGVRATIVGYSVHELDSDDGLEVRCYNNAGTATTPTGNNPANCGSFLVNTGGVVSGTTTTFTVNVPTGDSYYVITVNSVDVAGNVTATATPQRTILRDTKVSALAPAVTVNRFTIDNVAGTATVEGVVRDNIEIGAFDPRFRFPGLTAGATDVPDEVPFGTLQTVGTFGIDGLPGTATHAANATAGSLVDGIAQTVGGGPVQPTNFGFGVIDLARNFEYDGIPFTAGTFNGFAPTLQSFAINASASTVDRAPTAGEVSQTTLNAVVTTDVGAANPIVRVYFYFVNPGLDGDFATVADNYNVLIGTTTAAGVQTGTNTRTFTFQQALTAAELPIVTAGGTTYPVFAIAVDADGDALISGTTVTGRP